MAQLDQVGRDRVPDREDIETMRSDLDHVTSHWCRVDFHGFVQYGDVMKLCLSGFGLVGEMNCVFVGRSQRVPFLAYSATASMFDWSMNAGPVSVGIPPPMVLRLLR